MEYMYFLPVPHHLSQIGLILDHYPCLLFFQKTIEAVHLLLFIKLKFSLIVLRAVRAILAPKKFFFFFGNLLTATKQFLALKECLFHLLLLKKQIVAPNSSYV